MKNNVLVTKDNKILVSKKQGGGGGGKVLTMNSIDTLFTPICEKYISYDSVNHSFIRSNKQYGWQWKNLGIYADFRIPIILTGDFEFSFIITKYIQYLTVLICTDYDSKQTKMRGFDFHDATLGAVKNFTGIITSGSDWYYFINKDSDSYNCYEHLKNYPYKLLNNKATLRRVNGVISLYLNYKLFYTYKDKFQYPVEIIGCMRTRPSRIDNFTIKQL